MDNEFGDRVGGAAARREIEVADHGAVRRVGGEQVSGPLPGQLAQNLVADRGDRVGCPGRGDQTADGVLFLIRQS